jgi:signal transduction histidine kinase
VKTRSDEATASTECVCAETIRSRYVAVGEMPEFLVGDLSRPGTINGSLHPEMEKRTQAAERKTAMLEDRDRIARDMHDRVVQQIFAVGYEIAAFRGRVSDPLLAARLTHVVDELDEAVRDLRSSIFQLTVTSYADAFISRHRVGGQ